MIRENDPSPKRTNERTNERKSVSRCYSNALGYRVEVRSRFVSHRELRCENRVIHENVPIAIAINKTNEGTNERKTDLRSMLRTHAPSPGSSLSERRRGTSLILLDRDPGRHPSPKKVNKTNKPFHDHGSVVLRNTKHAYRVYITMGDSRNIKGIDSMPA